MGIWRRLRAFSGNPPLSMVPMLPLAVVATAIAVVLNVLPDGNENVLLPDDECRYDGVVIESSRLENGQRCIVAVSGNGLSGINAQLFLAGCADDVFNGDTIKFYAKLQILPPSTEPEAFDYSEYLRQKGVALTAYVPENHYSVIRGPDTFLRKLDKVGRTTAALLDASNLSDGAIVFLKAALLGDAAEARKTIGGTFSAAGLAHVLALSGMHVATLYAVLTVFLFPLYLLRQRRVLAISVLLLLWIYAFVTGMSASVVRAVVMASCLGGAFVFQRTNSPVNAWLLAWTLLLLADAGNLYDAGFQMSFAATGAILLFLPRLSGICGAGRCGKYMWTYVMVSVVAMAGSGIVAAYHFHTFPVLFIVANILVGFLLPGVLGGGLLLCLLLWAGFDAVWLCVVIDWLYMCIEWVADFIANVEWAQMRNLWFPWWVMLPYFAMLLSVAYVLWQKNIRRAWVVTPVFAILTVVALHFGNCKTNLPEWFVSTAGGTTSVVCFDGSKGYYISPYEGSLLASAKMQAEDALENYLSRRSVDSLSVAKIYNSADNVISWNSYKCNFGNKLVVYICTDSILPHILADNDTRGADYLLVHGTYRGRDISGLVKELRPDTVLLASEMHWRRRARWTDSMRVASVPCLWLRHYRFGARPVD
ncbi:ComEC/Rec2 family competence protein [uncultured Muribaculum sp.]|uniref:ComEC/Rec2 family competence protein n=1 Tax=uncultured Muribaculum sp. TaxID=1918613 RepID=UPI0025B77489|nr:ComEC/Rec2 family competence protein [uncultured Muribaculum sp.]